MAVTLYNLTEKQYRIAEYLKQSGKECTAKEIGIGVARKLVSTDYVKAPLVVLINAGMVEKIERPCQPDRFKWINTKS